MKRLAHNKLIDWKNHPRRKPLIVRGARQVGKSYLIKQFAKTDFHGNILTIDFELHPKVKQVFEQNLDPKRIIMELENYFRTKVTPRQTLLFFDEVQKAPKALMALRYFYEQMPEQHIIAAGSLLEFVMGEDFSFPVGRVSFLNMYPLSFQEFLIANDYEQLAQSISHEPQKISELLHEKLRELLRDYFFVGGMPEAVVEFTYSSSMHNIFEVQASILQSYREDFAKYAPRANKMCMAQVFDSVAQNIGRPIVYSKLAQGFSGPTIRKAFDLMSRAQLFDRVCSTSPSGLPLSSNVRHKNFKTIYLDIGLMQQACGLQGTPEISKTKLLDIYRGALAEQFIGQELRTIFNQNIYFWNKETSSSTAEVDYLVSYQGQIIPIEVKSGPAGKLRSLHQLLKNYETIEKSYVFYDGPWGELPEQRLTFMPLYAVSQTFQDS